MKAFFKKISTSILVVILSFSLTFSNAAAVTYQAAAIPVVYSAWEVFVTIFALLGITISCLDTIEAKQQAAKELTDELVGWKVLKNEGQGDNDGDGEDDLYATFDITKFLDHKNNLVLTEDDLKDFKEFYQDNMAAPPAFKPVNSVDIKTMNYAEYKDWFVKYFQFEGWESDSNFNSFVTHTHNLLQSNNYSLIFYSKLDDNPSAPKRWLYCDTLALSNKLGFIENNGSNPTNAILTTSHSTSPSVQVGYESYANFFCNNESGGFNYKSLNSNNLSVEFYYNSYICKAFIVNGLLYDFNSMFSYPVNETSSRDSGSRVLLSSLITSTNNISNSITDTVNKVGDKDLTDLIISDDFDIIGGDRVYDSDLSKPVGDIVIPMPSGDAITDYQNGLITYEQFLDALNVTPIDKAQGTNLLTQEFLDTQTGIFNGVNSIIGFLQQIVAWLNNFIDSIVQAFLDMIVSLLLPADGFIDSEIAQITSKLDSLGVAPYDMSDIFDGNDENPFKNITIDVNGTEVVIVSFDYLPPFLDKFRPVIRGLLVLFMIFYSINQLLSLIRLAGMMEGGNINTLQLGTGSNVPKIEDKGGRR